MLNSKDYAVRDLTLQKKIRNIFVQQLRGLPQGGLATNKVNGKVYYYHVINGEKRYLGSGDNPIV